MTPGLKTWATRPPCRYARRGNAMIMAVAMTVMLAIIGSSFVIMSRLDRQAVRRVAENQGVDVAFGTVIERIQDVLADDVVDNDTGNPAGFLDGFNANVTTPTWDSRETYDASNHRNPWLAEIEPDPGTGQLHVSEIWEGDPLNPYTPAPIAAGVYNPQPQAVDGGVADADGDGIVDSRWRPLPQVVIPGKEAYAAVRIIDNCGMINVNTAWSMHIPNPPDPTYISAYNDLYGQWLSLVDLNVLVDRLESYPIETLNPVVASQSERLVSNSPFYGLGEDEWVRSARFHDAIVMRLAKPHTSWYDINGDGIIDDGSLFGVDETAGGWWQAFRPFGIEDELELRNRFFLNSGVISRLENTWWPLLGTGHQRQDDDFPRYPLSNEVQWGERLVGGGGPWPDQRHLLTTYSWDRTLGIVPGLVPTSSAAIELRNAVGFARSINIPRVLRELTVRGDVLNPGYVTDTSVPLHLKAKFNPADPANADGLHHGWQAMRKIVAAFGAAGLPADQGYQFAANVIDYYDMDGDLTVIDPTTVQTALATIGSTLSAPPYAVYGFEAQPFITEIVTKIKKSGVNSSEVTWMAIELYNPYNVDIDLTPFMITCDRFDAGPLMFLNLADINNQPIATPVVLGSGQRIVLCSDLTDTVIAGLTEPTKTDLAQILVTPALPLSVTAPINNDIQLQRKVMTTGYSGILVVDRIDTAVVSNVTAASNDAVTYYVAQRGPKVELDVTIPLPDRFDPSHYPIFKKHSWLVARNRFGAILSNTAPAHILDVPTNGLMALGTSLKPNGYEPVGMNPEYTYGLPLLNSVAWNDPSPITYSWSDLSKILRVGPITAGAAAGAAITMTDQLNNRRVYQDTNPADGTSGERTIRLDVTEDMHAKLLGLLSFYGRADNGIDDADEDGDLNPSTFDSLHEGKIPGRININTAPKGVLKAIIPSLYANLGYDNDILRNELANWIIEHRPYENMADFAEKLAGGFDADRSTPNDNEYWYFSKWLAMNNTAISDDERQQLVYLHPRDFPLGDDPNFSIELQQTLQQTNQGDPRVMGDFEERDYIFHRMANLITTRSDTFTAYILVRVQDASGYVEKRVMALFDRSNVYLPKAAVRAGVRPGQFIDADGDTVYDEGEEWGDIYKDTNGNNILDVADQLVVDINGDGLYDQPDFSGDLIRMDPFALHNDPNYADRQYVTPKVVAVRVVPDPR